MVNFDICSAQQRRSKTTDGWLEVMNVEIGGLYCQGCPVYSITHSMFRMQDLDELFPGNRS